MLRYAPMVLIFLLVIAFRLIGSAFPEVLPNFQPVSALFFCGAMMARGWRQWAIPLAIWLLTYPAPAFLEGNFTYLMPSTLIGTGLAFAMVFYLGKMISPQSLFVVISGSILAAITFHIFTNSMAWISSPIYAKNLHGLWQSLWLGPEASPIPSWVFLRNMSAANLLFTSIFLSARFTIPRLFSSNLSLMAR